MRKKRSIILNGISTSMVHEILDDPCFNFKNCPICDRKLPESSMGPMLYISCENDCYSVTKLKMFGFIKDYKPWCVRVFDYEFFINIGVHCDRHYSSNYFHFITIKKKIERTIEYYKSNERYVMKFLKD